MTGCTRSPSGCRRSAAKYDLPYTTGPLARQYLMALRTIIKLALPGSVSGRILR